MASVAPFQFRSMHPLIFLISRRAKNIEELRAGIAEVPDSSLFFHTHHELHQHEALSPEPPNDFAFWVRAVFQDPVLAERIAGLDLGALGSIPDIRRCLLEVIDGVTGEDAFADRNVPRGMEFHFMKALTFVLPTGIEARDLREFGAGLGRVPISSISFHMFSARLQMKNDRNEFSCWLRDSLGEARLAEDIGSLDPYTQSMENLRARLIRLVERRLREVERG